MRSLLGRRDVRLLLAGQTLSMFGDWAMIIVLGIWAKVLTGSNAQAGLVFFVFALASLAAPAGGLLVDRVHKRPLMIATHVAMAGVVCLLFFVHDASQMWLLYLITALYGLGGDVFGAARSAMLKAMLPDELLAEANGALQSIREGLRLVAPLAGAGIYAAFGGGVVALVDAASFLASAATLIALPFAEPERAVKEHHFLREISMGVTHIARTRALRELTIGVAAALLVVGFSETLIFALAHALHRSPAFIGVMDSFQGVGAILGGLTSARLMRRIGELRLAGIGLAVFGLGDICWLVPRLGVVLPVDRDRRPRDRLGDRRARNRLPAPQPLRAAGPGRGGREYALQRAADPVDRSGRRTHHIDRLPLRDRCDVRRAPPLGRVSVDAPGR